MPKYAETGRRPDLDGLIESTANRGGLFTTEEAERYAVSRRLLSHYVRSGKLIRVVRGVYRPRAYPTHQHEDVITCILAVGEGSVAAGPTALDLYLPGQLVTNKVFVRRGPSENQQHIPSELKQRLEVLDHKEQKNTVWDGVPTENINDAFRTASDFNLLDPEQVERVTDRAQEQGLITTVRV